MLWSSGKLQVSPVPPSACYGKITVATESILGERFAALDNPLRGKALIDSVMIWRTTHMRRGTQARTLTRRSLLAHVAALAGAVVLGACSSSSVASGTAATPATQPATTGGSSPAATAAASPVAAQKVNANTASVAELQRAFEAAGISNAARWAREVEEYRPYPTDDPSFGKLRRELAKYNPGPGVVDQIVAMLTL
jgi:DNA uptake protein ComE-like DNA-binding protein